MSVRRVYVEKKPAYAVKAHELKEEIASYLGIVTVTDVRVLIRYDIENLSEETYKTALETIFSEPPVDEVLKETLSMAQTTPFFCGILPGQFDQRANSAAECIQIISKQERPLIKTAKVYVLYGNLSRRMLRRLRNTSSTP